MFLLFWSTAYVIWFLFSKNKKKSQFSLYNFLRIPIGQHKNVTQISKVWECSNITTQIFFIYIDSEESFGVIRGDVNKPVPHAISTDWPGQVNGCMLKVSVPKASTSPPITTQPNQCVITHTYVRTIKYVCSEWQPYGIDIILSTSVENDQTKVGKIVRTITSGQWNILSSI